MINLDFKYLKVKNAFCFGPDGIEIDFTKLGNIIHLHGENCDVQDEEEIVASNGIGKSSIPECIIYALFGSTIKGEGNQQKIGKDDVINKKIGKKLEIDFRWSKYRVLRKRKPNGLQFWELKDNGEWDEQTRGEMEETQKLINEKIGLNYDSLINLLVFTDNNANCFLECDNKKKREIVENMMSLQEFRQDAENAKKEKNGAKNQITLALKLYEEAINAQNAAKKRIIQIEEQEKNWIQVKEKEIETLTKKRDEKKEELRTSDVGKLLLNWQTAQNALAEALVALPELEKKKILVSAKLGEARTKLDENRTLGHTLTMESRAVEMELQAAKIKIKTCKETLAIKEKEGAECPYCFGTIEEKNYKKVVDKAQKEIVEQEELIAEKTTFLAEKKAKAATQVSIIKKYEDAVKLMEVKEKEASDAVNNKRREINNLSSVQKPEMGVAEKIIEEQIASYEKQIESKRKEAAGPSPYVDILRSAKEESETKDRECVNKKEELEKVKANLPYYEYWLDGFGPNGIPKLAIKRIIPRLNSRIGYWLQFLIDGKIKLTFDDNLNEIIERNPPDGDPFVYHVMSGGERRRLNLAVSQAFAYVMEASCNASPSVAFLDEVTTNIDQLGVIGVYNMIVELAKEKQVFVTTHDQGLIDLLTGCEKIFLRKKDGFTKIVNN